MVLECPFVAPSSGLIRGLYVAALGLRTKENKEMYGFMIFRGIPARGREGDVHPAHGSG